MRAAYATLRDHARARLIPFTITFEYFEQFAVQCEYVSKTGPFAQCLTVDRIENRLGYEPGNIQPLTRSRNSEKRAKQDQVRMAAGLSWRSERRAA